MKTGEDIPGDLASLIDKQVFFQESDYLSKLQIEEQTDAKSTASSWSAFPSPPPVESPSRQTPTVETVYDPTSGRVVTKRESNGGKELDRGVEKGEDISSVEVTSRVYRDVKGSSSVSSSIRRKGKSRSVFVCESCGYSDGQWWGTCRECGEIGTMKRCTTESADEKVNGTQVSENVVRSWLPKEATPVRLSEVSSRIDESNWRLSLLPLLFVNRPGVFGAEVERVLGGGLVPGSLVLVGGDPGVGKSTLLLQIAALIAEGMMQMFQLELYMYLGKRVLSKLQTELTVCVLGQKNFFCIQIQILRTTVVLSSFNALGIEDILEQAQPLFPRALVIDSIQTVYLRGVNGSAGGEKLSSHRLLRSVKNRFGSTDELGVFKMSESGLQGVSNPSEMFLGEQHSNSDYLAGLAVAVIMDGSRAFLIEIQALCVAGSSAVRHLNGVQGSRADMIISGIFLNVVSGISLTETSGDLAIAAAICSRHGNILFNCFLEFPIPNGVAFIAEIDLSGELRMVPQLEKRVNTLAKLGYKKCIVPKPAEKSFPDAQLQGMEILGCVNLKEMINTVFRRS
ncbi:hypothetical protein DH2020_041135 [Rehmannia glutinosa]|uniref:LapB rubredoxin metal binding domain-containing protein n=1 Tax=Rehmannia glutinosa TaxID=99300 RepID=A0ABR0US77_REHGL